MSESLVSIVVTTYNRPELLQKTLASLVAQTYRPIEIWVVDDGSDSNKNAAVCSAFAEVTYWRIPNSGGPSKPRNLGIAATNGAYVAFVDDDDLWHPKKLEHQMALFRDKPDVGLVHSYCQCIDKSGKLLNKTVGRPDPLDLKTGDVRLKMLGNWTLMTSTVLVKKSVLDLVGEFNEAMPPLGEDMEYWCRCSFYTNFGYVDKALVQYRLHKGISKRNQNFKSRVPYFLMAALNQLRAAKRLNEVEYELLKTRLIRMQLIRLRPGLMSNLLRIFKWNPLWIFNFDHLKQFLISLFNKRP